MNVAKLHFITRDCEVSHRDQALAVLEAGVRWVQVRTKGQTPERWERIAREVTDLCHDFGAVCIVNDNPEISRLVGADGVHIGQEDCDPLEARRVIGPDKYLGGTANSLEQMKQLAVSKVDYIGLGPLRFTSTKENLSPILGIEGVKRILGGWKEILSPVPVVIIGGVVAADVPEIIAAGAHGVAVSSAILSSENKSQAVAEFRL